MWASQPARFVANGLAAAVVHFLVLAACLELAGVQSAGLSNLLAALAGISASFVGNRYFVFRSWSEPVLRQLGRFWLLYAAVAALHGLVLLLWTDLAGFDYRLGFLLAAAVQAVCTYVGAKHWVFRPAN